MMDFTLSYVRSHPWQSWLLGVTLIVLGFFPSLGSSPPLWQDEIQIIDYGRVLFDPLSDWAVTWSSHHKAPMPTVCYLGCAGAELAFQVSGSVLGSRLFCLGGGIAFSVGILALALSMRLDGFIAVVLALIAFLEAGLLASYRSGRVDAWSLALVVAGTWLVHRSVEKTDSRWLIVAGLCLGLAPYVWMRSLMAIPSAAIPLAWGGTLSGIRVWRMLGFLVACTLGSIILFSPPAWAGIGALTEAASSPVAEFRALGRSGAGHSLSDLMFIVLVDLREMFTLSVPIILLAIVGAYGVHFRRFGGASHRVLLASIITATLAAHLRMATGMNPYAGLYWLPLLWLLALEGTRLCVQRHWLRPVLVGLVGIHLLYNVVGRSYRGWTHRHERGPNFLAPVAEALPSHLSHIVVSDFRLYFFLRQRGMKPMYLISDVDTTLNEPLFRDQRKFAVIQGGPKSLWTNYASDQLPKPVVIQELPMGYRLITGSP